MPCLIFEQTILVSYQWTGNLGTTAADTQPTHSYCHVTNQSLLQELILAVPPFQAAKQGPVLTTSDFNELRTFVDFFSLMTYDASTAAQPGPNAPWKWVKSNVQAVMSQNVSRCAESLAWS